MKLTQLQQEAREEFRNEAGVVYSENSLGPIVDKVVARVYAAALDSVEADIEAIKGFLITKSTPEGISDITVLSKPSILSHLRALREGITGNEHVK